MRPLVLFFATWLLGSSTPASTNMFYVAPNGNNAWSGRLEKPNAAGTDGPVQSLIRARDAIR